MPSSPIATDSGYGRLLDALTLLTDPRAARGRRYRLNGLLTLTVLAVLVAAFDTGLGAVLGQLCVDTKTNEIPTARTLLKPDLAHVFDFGVVARQ